MTARNGPTTETTGVRCPACGARNAASAGWCTLCYADMTTPAPEPVRFQDPEEPAAVEEPEPQVDALLLELAARERPTSRWAGLGQAVATPGARVALMLVGTLVVTGGGFGLLALFGSLL